MGQDPDCSVGGRLTREGVDCQRAAIVVPLIVQ